VIELDIWSSMEELNQMLNFAPDSPLFVRQLSMYSADLERLGDFLQAMIKMMRQFQKDSASLAKSANVLGSFMRSGLGQSETNAHLLPFIKKFGEIFTEISNSQEILSESLETTFSLPLEQFCQVEISSLHQMKASYTSLRDAGEASILRYLQSDVSNFGRGATQGSLEQRAHDLVLHKRKFELSRFDLVHKINEVESRKVLEISEACVSGMYALRSHHRICENRFHSCDAYMAELQKCQEKEKETLAATMNPLEKKRRDVTSVLDAMVERVEMASSFTPDIVENNGGGIPLSGGSSSSSNVSRTSLEGGGGHNTNSSNPGDGGRSSPSPTTSLSSLSRMGYNFIGGLAKNIGGDKERNTRSSTTSSGFLSGGGLGMGIASMTMEGRSGRRMSVGGEGGLDGGADGYGDASQFDSCENCEARMKALDNTELNPFYRISAAVAPAGLVKQGYLWKRSDKQKLLENWKRQWFVLDETKLYFIKERPADGYSSFQVQTVCDLMLASVRVVTDLDLPFCFRVSNANVDSIIVQAEGQKDYQSWLNEFRNAIERRLTSGQAAMHASPKPSDTVGGGIGSSRPSLNSLVDVERSENVASKRELNAAVIASILEHNPLCAECDRSNPPPEWVSLNLGCVVCIDCSGVHRALGVHVSKMRSLKLDDLEPEEYEVLELIGNAMNNSVWEQKIPPAFKKPSPSATHAVRDRYIRDKYELKKYLDKPDEVDMKTCTAEVMRACETNDVASLFKTIAVAGPACFITSDTFPLHMAAKRDASACCMLLLVNGSDVLARDANSLTPSEVASIAGHTDLASFLMEREEHILATRSRSNSNASSDSSVTGISNLNNEFDSEGGQLNMKDMVSKALSSSEEELDGECSTPRSNVGESSKVNSLRENTGEVKTE